MNTNHLATPPAIRIDRVSRHFGAMKAVDDVTLTVPHGSIFALIGANGAGKTTLFSMIAGYLQPSAGSIHVGAIDVAKAGGALQGHLGILPQDAAFLGAMDVSEQLVLFARLGGASPEAARALAREALAGVGLAEAAARRPRELSHGMHKRLGIAQAFLGAPDVVLLDEPTAGLDPANAAQIRRLVRAMAGNRTVVVSSHNLAELQDICDHVAIMDHGRLVTAGPMAAFLGTGSTVRIRLNRAPPESLVAALAAHPDVTACTPDADAPPGAGELVIHFAAAATTGAADVETDPADRIVAELLRMILDAGLVPRALSDGARLEARFLELTR